MTFIMMIIERTQIFYTVRPRVFVRVFVTARACVSLHAFEMDGQFVFVRKRNPYVTFQHLVY